jgi:hypothetical protein
VIEREKEIPVTLRTSIVTVGAVLALIAPAAASARAVTNLYADAAVSVAQGNHGVKSTLHKAAKKKSVKTKVRAGAKSGVYTAPFGSKPIVGPRYIYVPAPTTAPSAYVDPNECQDNGTNCTDPQLCEFWGENCGTPIPAAATDPADSTPAVQPTGTDSN